MTDNITVAMVFAARDLVQQAIGSAHLGKDPDGDSETISRAYRTIYRAIAESVFHSGGGKQK